jgi:hypothetical protein
MKRLTVKRLVAGVAVFCVIAFSSASYLAAQDIQTPVQTQESSAAADDVDAASEGKLHWPDSRVITGYKISPVELDLRRKNRLLVGLGSYIVNAAGACNDCHTNPPFAAGGDPFRGEAEVINTERFLAGGRPFGPIVSPNITPDEFGRPAGLTFEEFAALMRTGRDPEAPDRILQVMPWNIYGKLTTQDLRAIYEYLRAVPSLPSAAPPEP